MTSPPSDCRGAYWPTISMNLPSRGLFESATTMRYTGAFLRPMRRRRIRTAIGVLPDVVWWCSSGLLACSAFPSRTRGRSTHAHHSGRHAHAALPCLLHHLLHVAELREEVVDLAHRPSRTLRDARAARPVDDPGCLPLGGRHREHDRLEMLHPPGVHVRLLEHLAVHARQHLEQPLEGTE